MAPPPPKRRSARQPTVTEEVRKRLDPKGPKRWGKVARQGAGTMKGEDEATASGAWRDAMKKARERDIDKPAPARHDDSWHEHKPRKRKPKTKERVTSPLKVRDDVADELAKSTHEARGPRLKQRLKQAADAFEHERFEDAARLLKTLAEIAPAVAGVHELYGLTLYRLGKYKDAVRELKTYVDITKEVDQHPVLADCYRALKRWKMVDELWDELRQASPSAELVAEGRIVAAGAQADQGNIPAAIALLEQARADPKRPKDHHLRLWYALADLYERAGDVPKARRLFRRIADIDRDFFDVRERLRAVG